MAKTAEEIHCFKMFTLCCYIRENRKTAGEYDQYEQAGGFDGNAFPAKQI